MNTLRRHRLFVAISAVALLIVCGIAMMCVSEEAAEIIGITYIAILTTIILAYDIIHEIEKKDENY